MNVYDFAMQMETDGKAYYENLAKKTDQAGLKTIFTHLAEDEQKHFDIFQKLKSGTPIPDMPETGVLDEAKNVFAGLPKGASALQGLSGNLDAYRHAMQLEAESFRLYEEAAAKVNDRQVAQLLLKIAEEEHKHFNILDNIYEFVNAPNEYLAWGEFSNLEDFHQFGRDTDE